ncbi:hypothetical protein HPB51_003540 [Rhipicephalus microplus]|uniref:Uncharacterized protein n=1 Tax=Rhipicephalus microplus TaxID=6941 RepID=A0A9J6D8L4_RHIMP|nr:hypothetical protein HPB51_003540 [Rhipicephalus microplus]
MKLMKICEELGLTLGRAKQKQAILEIMKNEGVTAEEVNEGSADIKARHEEAERREGREREEAGKQRVQRVLIINVIDDVALVWSIDHDHFHSVRWDNLINDAASLRSMSPTFILTVLQDVEAVPFMKLLRECVNAPRVMTNHGTNEETFHTFMVTKVMAFGRCQAACVPKTLLRLDDFTRGHFPVGDDSRIAMVTEEKRALMNLLDYMFSRHEQLLLELAETRLFEVVMRVHKSLPLTSTLHRDVERCLHAILGVSSGRCSPQWPHHHHQQQQRQSE